MTVPTTTPQMHTAAPPDVRPDGVLFAVSFAVFMAIALFGSLLGLPWRSWLPGSEGVPTVHGAVKAAVYTFMSHIL